MTRVLVLSDLWLPFPGGAERLMSNLATYLHEHGADVQVLTGYEAARRQPDGPWVTAQPIGDGDGDPGWEPVAAFIGLFRPDVILTHHHYARLFDEQLAATGLPLVQVVLNGRRSRNADLAVYITKHVRDFDPTARPSDLTIWPPAGPDTWTTGHGDAIGFIKPVPHKGAGLVYQLAQSMPKRRFLVLRGEWQNLETIRAIPNVEFMEPVEDIREFYARVRLMLMPSISEDAGTVPQEATANGIPCISSYVGGLWETNGGGIRLAPEDAMAWRYAIESLDDPGRYRQTVENMRAHYDRHDHPRRLAEFAERIGALA